METDTFETAFKSGQIALKAKKKCQRRSATEASSQHAFRISFCNVMLEFSTRYGSFWCNCCVAFAYAIAKLWCLGSILVYVALLFGYAVATKCFSGCKFVLVWAICCIRCCDTVLSLSAVCYATLTGRTTMGRTDGQRTGDDNGTDDGTGGQRTDDHDDRMGDGPDRQKMTTATTGRTEDER